MVVFLQDRAPHVAKDLLWEPDMPGPLPLLPPGPGKELGLGAPPELLPLTAASPAPCCFLLPSRVLGTSRHGDAWFHFSPFPASLFPQIPGTPA